MIRINLLPKERQKEKKDSKRVFILIAILIYTIIGASYVWLWQQEAELRKEVNKLQAKLNTKRNVLGKLKKVQKQEKELLEKIDTIAKLLKENPVLVRNIEITTRNIPYQKIFLNKLNTKKDVIELNAFTSDLKNIADYIKILESQKQIKKVLLTNTRQKDYKGEKLINFNLKIEMNNEN